MENRNDLTAPDIRHADTEAALRASYAVMRELRPHLQSYEDFATRVQRMTDQNYRILTAWQGDTALAVAGYRLQENLVYGRFLYVDDLVTSEASRGQNLGARLLEALTDIAMQENCDKLVLDTALSNALAQRFYFREGLLTGAIRFHKFLSKAAA